VRSCRSDGAILMEVENTGTYIRPDEQEQLFDRFFRASGAVQQAIGGVGLGLAICKAIAEAHGGQISVSSEEGGGTNFVVLLPAPERPEADLADLEHEEAMA
jgi:two-component system, OmpR family, phosphate regulon sensor histidine kinase PhoR